MSQYFCFYLIAFKSYFVLDDIVSSSSSMCCVVVSILDVGAAMLLIVNRLIRHLFCYSLLSSERNL